MSILRPVQSHPQPLKKWDMQMSHFFKHQAPTLEPLPNVWKKNRPNAPAPALKIWKAQNQKMAANWKNQTLQLSEKMGIYNT